MQSLAKLEMTRTESCSKTYFDLAVAGGARQNMRGTDNAQIASID